jgi:transaldolase
MMSTATTSIADEKLRTAAKEALGFSGRKDPGSDPALSKLRELGTELWLDTGNLEEAQSIWTSELSALTTNNTLVNQVVQTGVLDDVVADAVEDLRRPGSDLTEDQEVMELGFIVNCHVALRLVKAFGANVSVELHPGISEDIEQTVRFAERYYAVCPERFYVKIPLSPEGYCAVAQARAKGIPINYTLGFSARQNYVAAVVSNPTYCNVFLGRLNAVVSDNRLGDGKNVGEKTAMATQMAIRELRDAGRTQTKLIAASMRDPTQVASLAGTDVYTMPPKVAKAFLDSKPDVNSLTSQLGRAFDVDLHAGVDPKPVEVLWTIDDKVKALTDELARRGGANLTGDEIRDLDKEFGAGLFHRFTSLERADIQEHGKIPDLDRFKHDHDIALDDLMTQSALQSFVKDQSELDEYLRDLIHTK